MGMFAKKQKVGHCADFARSNQPLLERGGFAVSDSAKIDSAAVAELFTELSRLSKKKPKWKM